MLGEVIADRYELEELVGTGGMSSVYRATDRLLERSVALKILHASHAADKDTIERFRREARAVAQLSHPNVVTVIDRGDDAGRQYIVFELVDGENLKGLVDREGPLPLRRALELAIGTGSALAYAHQNGIVHRDVKPQNVLINGDGQPKVTDFGIAHSLHVGAGMTQTGTVLGTSRYIAPEQASGEPIGPATDVYALGVVVFELLTGEVPFSGESFVAVALRHVNEPPPSVFERRADVPARLAHAVDRALAKAPGDRFPSMGAFVAELEACLHGLGEQPSEDATAIRRAPVGPARSRPRRPAKRTGGRGRGTARRMMPLGLLLAGLALLAAVVTASILLRSDPDDEPGAANGRPAARVVELTGVAAADPGGDRREHDVEVPLATDGQRSTAWRSETYRFPNGELGKDGVGIVLDAGEATDVSSVTVATDTPGFTAEIRAGDGRGGPFEPVSPARKVQASTSFAVDVDRARYYVVWITNLGASASVRVNEVTARS